MQRDQLGELDATLLLDAYVRRRRWEYQELAAAVWMVLGQAMEGQSAHPGQSSQPYIGKGAKARKVSPKEFIFTAGAKLQ